MTAALTLLAALGLPALLLYLEPRLAPIRALGPVVWAYGLGLLAANLRLPIHPGVAHETLTIATAFALPLLLFAADVRGWLHHAPRAVLGFALCLIAATTWALIGHALFAPHIEAPADVTGMLLATYTGGTPNMVAVAQALGAPPERFIAVNAADLAAGGVWLLLMLTLIPRLGARIFAPTRDTAPLTEATHAIATHPKWHYAIGPLLAGACIALGLAAAELPLTAPREMTILLTLSATATALSLSPRIRALPGLLAQGRYGLLAFCFAAGSLADLADLFGDGLALFALAALIVSGTVITHLTLARLCRLDRDTAIITCAAGIFGPALIPPIVDAIGNRRMLLSGVSTSLVGLVLGTWLGVGVALWLR